MKKYPKYKDSGIQWIGQIPEEWTIIPLKSILLFLTDGTHKTPNYVDEGIPFVSIKDMSSGKIDFSDTKFISEEEHRILSKHAPVKKGDILFSRIGTLGVFIKVDTDKVFDIFVSLGLMKIIPSTINTDYLVYYLSSSAVKKYIDIVKAGEGTSAAKFNLTDVRRTSILFPSLIEQQSIVAFLDEKTSKIDECIRLLELQKTDLTDYRKAIISQVVTRGLNPNVPMKDSGIQWIGQIPEGWIIKRIRDVATFHNGDRGSNYPSGSDLVENGVPFLTSNNLHQFEIDIEDVACKYITPERYSILGGAKIQINDIVFCLRGSIGNCSINKQLSEGTIASSLMVIRPTQIEPDYLNYLLHSNIASKQTENYMNGTCAANLSADNVSKFKIPVPPLSEQQAIVDYLDSKTSKLDEAIKRIDEQIADLRAYRTALISDVVTGKIDVRNAN